MISGIFTREEMERFASDIANATCFKLVEMGILELDTANTFVNEWTPILVPKESILSQFWEKIFPNETPGKRTFLIRFTQIWTNKR